MGSQLVNSGDRVLGSSDEDMHAERRGGHEVRGGRRSCAGVVPDAAGVPDAVRNGGRRAREWSWWKERCEGNLNSEVVRCLGK